MAKATLVAGTVSYVDTIWIADSSSTTGAGKSGLVFNTSGLTCYYKRSSGTASVAVTLVTITTLGTFASGGFKEVDATNQTGLYEFHPPNAAFASGAKNVTFVIQGAANGAPQVFQYEISATDNQDAVHGGMSALPNVASGADGGVALSGATQTLNLKQLNIVNSAGDALIASSTGSSGQGINASGSGTGAGIKATGGGTGAGLSAVGGSTSGDAILTAATSGHGITAAGTGTTKHGINATGGATTSHGISATGGGVGHGLLATSGGGATGDGIKAVAASTNGNGLNLVGVGTGAGELATGGLTGNGVKYVGGGTSGDALLTAVTSGHGATFAGTGTTKHGINATGGATTSHGIAATGGGVGHGILATSGGGATGDGIRGTAASTNGNGLNLLGVGTGAGALATGGGTGQGAKFVGGATSGDGIDVTTTAGDGISVLPTAGNGLVLTANGTSKHGAVVTGGTAGTSDGLKAVAGTGGVDVRGNVTGSVTGNLSGSVGSVTAAVTITGQIKKNTTFNNFTVPMYDATDHVSLKSGLTVTGTVSIDGAAYGALTNAIAEIGATGTYKVNLAAADTNGTVLALKFSATGADATLIGVITET